MRSLSVAPYPVQPRFPGLDADRCAVMGILNVTPDSFSDGRPGLTAEQAVLDGLALVAAGADLVDVGGESTRPGAARVPAEEELRRVLPVVRALASSGVRVSIDTTRALVAEAAVEAGASVVNDVSGGLADPAMARAVAACGVTYVAMHWRAPSDRMHHHAVYADVVAEVCVELRHRVDHLVAAGIDRDRIVVDPGLGFAKEAAHSWDLLSHLDRLHDLGLPVLVGASRKAFLGAASSDGSTSSPRDRDHMTSAVTALAAAAGAACVRVHDVRSSRDAATVAAMWIDHS